MWLLAGRDRCMTVVFDNSRVRAMLETGPRDGYLTGDGGYVCRQYLLTPVVNPATEAERKFNAIQISARNFIERANGILKRRFPRLGEASATLRGLCDYRFLRIELE